MPGFHGSRGQSCFYKQQLLIYVLWYMAWFIIVIKKTAAFIRMLFKLKWLTWNGLWGPSRIYAFWQKEIKYLHKIPYLPWFEGIYWPVASLQQCQNISGINVRHDIPISDQIWVNLTIEKTWFDWLKKQNKPIPAQKSRGNSVLRVVFSHTMPKMDFHYSHRFSWEKTH